MKRPSNTIFSHRPIAGISVGARKVDGMLYVAFALVNDGTSSNGVFWQDRRDQFSRAVARQIINGRLDYAIDKENVIEANNPYILSFETDMSARQFMAAFRKTFKPVPDESDEVFTRSRRLDNVNTVLTNLKRMARSINESIGV